MRVEGPASETFADDPGRRRFTLTDGAHVTFADYRREEDRLVIVYVEAPVALRGTGAAGRLLTHVAADARARGLKILPLCGYAASWFRRHPEHADLMAV